MNFEDLENQEKELNQNLAFFMQDNELQKLSAYLLDLVEKDERSRQKWFEPIKKVQSYLGFESIEDINISVEGLTKTIDPTFATAIIRIYSLLRAEFFGEKPVDYAIEKNRDNQITEQIAEEIKSVINNYLTKIDRNYITDSEKLIMHCIYYGSAFKKVYFDEFIGGPVVRFINPLDFIIDINCTNIFESNRMTHVFPLSKREIIFNIQNGIYKDNENLFLNLQNENEENRLGDFASKNLNDDDSNQKIYEIHTYLNLDEFTKNLPQNVLDRTMPLRYIVTIAKSSGAILEIRANFDLNDPRKPKKNYFVPYMYLPGFGVMGLGLAHLIGSTAISLTRILRILIDSGYYASLPCGFVSSGFIKNQNNTIRLSPGELYQLDTGGLPINQLYGSMPFAGPSPVLHQLRLELIDQIQNLAASSELGLGDTNSNMPVGTTLALLGEQLRIRSAIAKSFYNSLCYELDLFYSLFKETTNPAEIIGIDIYPPEINIIPNVDPSINSSTQKIIKAETLLKTAFMQPELHNIPEVFRIFYEAIGIAEGDIQKILKSPEELQMQAQGQNTGVDPNSLMMAQIETEQANTEARERIADKKAESEAFKAQLNFEATKAKIQSDEAIAELKAKTELAKSNQF